MIIFCCFNYLNAQNTSGANVYRTWVFSIKKPDKIQGIFYSLKDSSIVVANAIVPNGEKNKVYSKKVELHIRVIDKIYIRKKNKKGKGALLGAFVGFAVGFVIGYAQGDDPPCSTTNPWNVSDIFCNPVNANTKGFIVAVPMTFAGAALGMALGSIKIKIPINGEMKKFQKNRRKLNSFSIN